jgi:hypothetical protein
MITALIMKYVKESWTDDKLQIVFLLISVLSTLTIDVCLAYIAIQVAF